MLVALIGLGKGQAASCSTVRIGVRRHDCHEATNLHVNLYVNLTEKLERNKGIFRHSFEGSFNWCLFLLIYNFLALPIII